ncbi:MAG TPA: SGNH/GDSL hydrolase family protein [Pyrinomonadaceae bacterium]
MRLINYRPAILDPNIYLANNDELLPYRLRPGYQGNYLGQEVKIDGEGNRVVVAAGTDGTLDATNERGGSPEKVVLLVGDSVVFGYGLRDEETIASRLQGLLRAKGSSSEVQNIAAPGYSSWNEYAAIADYLKRHSATDLIIAYVPNDVTFENDYFDIGKGKLAAFSDGWRQRLTHFLYSRVYTSFLISDTLKKLYHRFGGGAGQAAGGGMSEQESAAALDYSMQALSRVQALCRERGIRFAVGIYRDAVGFRGSPEKSLAYEETIRRSLEQRGIESFLIKAHAENLSDADVRVFWNDPHPSARAVALMAGEVLKEIE